MRENKSQSALGLGLSGCWERGGGSEAVVREMRAEQVRAGEVERSVWVPDGVEPCEAQKQQTNPLWVDSEDRGVMGGFRQENSRTVQMLPPLRILLVQAVSSLSQSDFILES